MSSVNKDERIAHLPRADRDETFCGLPLAEGLLLSSKLEAADCDSCIAKALAEGASITDRRRDHRPNRLEEILSLLTGKAVHTLDLEKSLDPEISRVCDHFLPWQAELAPVPEHLLNQMFIDFPAYALSAEGFFPTPEAMCISMLSFYIEALKIAVEAGDLSQEQGIARLDRVKALTDFIHSTRTDADRESEYPLTVDQWPDFIRKAHL